METNLLPVAALATSPAPHVSSRYKFVPTLEYIQAFEARGWKLTNATQAKKRIGSAEHGKHMVTMLHEKFDNVPTAGLGGIVPRVHLVNSHDWSCRFSVIMGLFRLVCSNGLMVSYGAISAAKFRHDAGAKDISEVITDAFFNNVESTMRDAQEWSKIELTLEQQVNLALEARHLRFGEDSTIDPVSLLAPRRDADSGNSLWLVFNRLQENTTKGGIRFGGMARASRPLQAIDAQVKVNTGLWEAADNLASSIRG